jgi:hypothetical protein
MVLFFAANSFVNKDEFKAKVNKIENSSVKSQGPSIANDLQSADSLSALSDSSAMIRETVAVAAEQTEKVKLSFKEKLAYYKTDIPIIWAYILFIITILVTLIFPIVYMFLHPQNLLRSSLVFIGIAALVGLAFLIAPGNPIHITGYTGTANTNPLALKFIDAGLVLVYFILGITLLSIVVSEVIIYFRSRS